MMQFLLTRTFIQEGQIYIPFYLMEDDKWSPYREEAKVFSVEWDVFVKVRQLRRLGNEYEYNIERIPHCP